VLYTQHNVSKSDRSYIAGRVRSGYILYLAFAVSMLLLYSAINAAFADAGTGHRNISQLVVCVKFSKLGMVSERG
jgi:glycopeptide antibiotics resistance protein